jgi:hypothetical protein
VGGAGAACAIDDASDRAFALAELAARLPEPHRGRAVEEALAPIRRLGDDAERAGVLFSLGPLLPEPLVGEALAALLAVMRSTAGGWRWTAALEGLASHQLDSERGRSLCGAILRALTGGVWRRSGPEWPEAAELAQLAPYLPEPQLRSALAAARAIEDRQERAAALAVLVAHLPEPERGQALDEARAIVQELKLPLDHLHLVYWLLSGHPQFPAEALLIIATSGSFIEQAAGCQRASAMYAAAEEAAGLPSDRLYPLWREVLHFASGRSREDLLISLKALIPVLTALGGAEAAGETAHAILDVTRWWP